MNIMLLGKGMVNYGASMLEDVFRLGCMGRFFRKKTVSVWAAAK